MHNLANHPFLFSFSLSFHEFLFEMSSRLKPFFWKVTAASYEALIFLMLKHFGKKENFIISFINVRMTPSFFQYIGRYFDKSSLFDVNVKMIAIKQICTCTNLMNEKRISSEKPLNLFLFHEIVESRCRLRCERTELLGRSINQTFKSQLSSSRFLFVQLF